MPLGIFLLWPALHLMYGLKEYQSQKITPKQRYGGRLIIATSLLLINQPYGFEKGFFYWLFSFMAIALCFVQLRVWQPSAVNLITAVSVLGFIIQGAQYVVTA